MLELSANQWNCLAESELSCSCVNTPFVCYIDCIVYLYDVMYMYTVHVNVFFSAVNGYFC